MDDPFRIPEIAPRTQAPQVDPRTPRSAPSRASDLARPFSEVLSDTVSEVQRLQNEADTAIKKLVSGEVKDITEAMVAIEKADVSFQTMMAIRNKIVAAYEEVIRMQV